MKNETWKGQGYCKGRHILKCDDYCNKPVIKNGEYCIDCTCDVKGCKEKWGILWPLLGNTKLCDYHHRNPTASYKSLVMASNEPPDDFDIPV